MLLASLCLVACAVRAEAASTVHVYGDVRGRKVSTATAVSNTRLLNASLRALGPGDTLLIPNHTFTVMGGTYVEVLVYATVQLDGTLEFSTDIKAWPIAKGKMLRFVNSVSLTMNILYCTGSATFTVHFVCDFSPQKRVLVRTVDPGSPGFCGLRPECTR